MNSAINVLLSGCSSSAPCDTNKVQSLTDSFLTAIVISSQNLNLNADLLRTMTSSVSLLTSISTPLSRVSQDSTLNLINNLLSVSVNNSIIIDNLMGNNMLLSVSSIYNLSSVHSRLLLAGNSPPAVSNSIINLCNALLDSTVVGQNQVTLVSPSINVAVMKDEAFYLDEIQVPRKYSSFDTISFVDPTGLSLHPSNILSVQLTGWNGDPNGANDRKLLNDVTSIRITGDNSQIQNTFSPFIFKSSIYGVNIKPSEIGCLRWNEEESNWSDKSMIVSSISTSSNAHTVSCKSTWAGDLSVSKLAVHPEYSYLRDTETLSLVFYFDVLHITIPVTVLLTLVIYISGAFYLFVSDKQYQSYYEDMKFKIFVKRGLLGVPFLKVQNDSSVAFYLRLLRNGHSW